MNHQHRPSENGFSIIELVVAIAILGILLAIAIPFFIEYLAQSKRADGMGVLTEAAQFMERNFSDSGRYDQTDAGAAVALPVALQSAPRSSTAAYYQISINAVAESTFVLHASPTGSMTADACGTFTLTSTGKRDVTGGTKTASQCWR